MKNWLFVSVLVTGLVCVGTGLAQSQIAGQAEPTGKAFLKKAAEVNLGEVQLGKLAEQKGNNPAIQDFGKRMVQDHTKAESELLTVASKEGVTLPTHPSAEVESLDQSLQKVSGTQFDQMYIKHMLSGHKGAIAVFENEIEDGHNPAIKSYAENVLPVIQDHVRIAEDVAGKMDLAGRQGLEDPWKAITAPASQG